MDERNIELLKIAELKYEERVIKKLDNYSSVVIDDVMFRENVISEVKLFKTKNYNDTKDIIFVEFYSGLNCICTRIYKNDITLDLEFRERKIKSCQVRKARDYDYIVAEKEQKKETLKRA